MKFRNRVDAGNLLADRLAKTEHRPAIVLGIPRGGIIVADIVARKLGIDFDIVIPRKLGAPENEELAIGAVMEDGTSYINSYMVNALRVPPDYIENEMARQVREIRRRSAAYRKSVSYSIAGKNAILVDDGIATGATVIASARWARKRNPSRLIVAVPVAPPQSVDVLEQEVDSVIVLHTPQDFASHADNAFQRTAVELIYGMDISPFGWNSALKISHLPEKARIELTGQRPICHCWWRSARNMKRPNH
ncbi:MAG: phosphoribosyltransferase [Thaumarchaeota archaeon]|nr:MAG: phosphoribosyltransferase [Nitrososphaerota archaeon]